MVRPATSQKRGMPRFAAVLRRAEIWCISTSLLRAQARLTFMPSASANQRWVSASAMRAWRLSRRQATVAMTAGVPRWSLGQSGHFSGQFLLTQTVTLARSADLADRVGMVPDLRAFPESTITLA